MTCRAIPRIFDRHAVARLHQQLCTKANPLLCATGDHNLLSRALHASRTAQVRRNQLAQARITSRIAITQLLQIRFAPESRIQLGPDLERKQIESRHAHPKCPRRTTRRRGQMVLFRRGPNASLWITLLDGTTGKSSANLWIRLWVTLLITLWILLWIVFSPVASFAGS